MNKYNNPRLLNTVVSGTGMKNPVRPHVIIGSEENGFIRGDLMDANAIQELIVTEIAAREHGDEELTEYIDEKVQLAVDDLVDGAPEVLDTLKELSEALGDDANFATTITEEIASKVDKVEGKGLSTNDYTTAEKQKLAGIAAGAEVNVQSDWSLTNSSNDSFIKNKPTKLSLFTNDVPYVTEAGLLTVRDGIDARFSSVEEGLADIQSDIDDLKEEVVFTETTDPAKITPVKEVVTDLKSNEDVIAAALNNLNTGIEALNSHKNKVDNKIVEFDEVKQSFEDGLFVIAEAITKLKVRLDELDIKVEDNVNEVATYATKFTPDTVDVDDAADVFAYNTDLLQELVTNNNTEKLLTTTRNNKKLIVGTIRFFTDNFAHQVTAIATSNIHLDEWDKESSLSGVSHTDGKAYTYVCFCGLNDPAAYSGLQEGVWTDWKKLYPTMDDLDEAVNTLKNRQYMDSSTFDAIFTEADADAINYIIDNFAPTFYVKDSSNNVVAVCSVVRSATKVCVFRNRVDEQTGNAIQECRRGTIGTNGTIAWGIWMSISSPISHQESE